MSHNTPDAESSRQPFASIDLASARSYDAWYETPAGRQMALAEEALLAALLRRLPSARSLLEVGCGTGHFSRWFAAQGLAVVGCAPSPAMLAVAHERGGGPLYARASAQQLPFADASCDLVAFVTSLEFVPDPAAALREAARVARQGLLLGVLNATSPLGVWRRARALVEPSPYRQARFYTPGQLTGLARGALGERAQHLTWRTAIWPTWWPALLRRATGAFVALLVELAPPSSRSTTESLM